MKALVFSAGGALCSFQVGVVKALYENNIKFDRVYGSSGGALNAYGLHAGGVEFLENFWTSIRSNKDIYKSNWLTLGPLFGLGTFNFKPLEDKLSNLPCDDFIPATVCSVNLFSGNSEYFESSDPNFLERVLASSSIPLVFSSRNGYIDGGVREMSPIGKAIQDGYEEIVVVLAQGFDSLPEYNPPLFCRGIYDGLRALNILMEEILVNDIKLTLARNLDPKYKPVKISIITPKQSFLDVLEFDPAKIKLSIAHGYSEGLNYINCSNNQPT